MDDKRIVVIGAGSRSFGRGMIVDILKADELAEKGLSLWLVDINADGLDEMTRFAELVKAELGSDMPIHKTTDRTEALPGARYVMVAVEQHRMYMWEQDYRVPRSLGFDHVLGENGGPGALFHALRTIHLLIPICRDIERLCPDATLLNYTNPEARVLDAILHLTKVKAAGLCHGVFSIIRFVTEYVDKPAEALEFTSAGMNHLYMLQKVIDKETGKDLLPNIIERVKNDDELPMTVWKKFVQIYDWVSYKSDSHIGEYVPYGAEFFGARWPYGPELLPIGETAQYSFDPTPYFDGEPLDDHALRLSGEVAADIMVDMETNGGGRYDAVNVLNTEGYIPNLPTTNVIEIPAICDADGLHPITVDPIPEGPRAIMMRQLSIQRLLTTAYETRDRRLLLQALCIDPVVNSITSAEKLLDIMFELQKDFLPEFK